MHIRKRTAQRIITSLKQKGYLSFTFKRGIRGNYPIRVCKFEVASKGTSLDKSGVKRELTQQKVASNGNSVQEVSTYKKKREEETVHLTAKALKRASEYIKAQHARAN